MSDQAPHGKPVQIELQQQQVAVATAALRGGVPRLYANGFIVAQTASDMSIVLTTNGTATAVLNLSMITAKTLIAELQKPIGNLEKSTGYPVKNMAEMQAILNKHASKT